MLISIECRKCDRGNWLALRGLLRRSCSKLAYRALGNLGLDANSRHLLSTDKLSRRRPIPRSRGLQAAKGMVTIQLRLVSDRRPKAAFAFCRYGNSTAGTGPKTKRMLTVVAAASARLLIVHEC